MACSRFGTMLYLYTQKGEEAMNKETFQQHIGGTAACMKILILAKKLCGQLTSKYTFLCDSWFSGVRTAEEDMAEGVDYCGPVNTCHKGFLIATLEKLMKDWPGGSYLALKSTQIYFLVI